MTYLVFVTAVQTRQTHIKSTLRRRRRMWIITLKKFQLFFLENFDFQAHNHARTKSVIFQLLHFQECHSETTGEVNRNAVESHYFRKRCAQWKNCPLLFCVGMSISSIVYHDDVSTTKYFLSVCTSMLVLHIKNVVLWISLYNSYALNWHTCEKVLVLHLSIFK